MAHLEVWEGSGGPPGSPRVVERLTRRSGRVWRPIRGPGWVERPTQRSGMGQLAHL